MTLATAIIAFCGLAVVGLVAGLIVAAVLILHRQLSPPEHRL